LTQHRVAKRMFLPAMARQRQQGVVEAEQFTCATSCVEVMRFEARAAGEEQRGVACTTKGASTISDLPPHADSEPPTMAISAT
jgi:hypothetical protein